MRSRLSLLVAASCLALLPHSATAAATVVIFNNDPAGVGFNDPTVVAQVGGNIGTSLGQQRLNVYQAAAAVWGATLTSNVTIRVGSSWAALSCNATAAVLGSAGAADVWADFNGAPASNRWYPKALANKLAGTELNGGVVDINARFNVNLGQPGCLTGTFFYLGLDNNHAANVDLFAVLLHELGHGLGFQTFTSGATGNYFAGIPSVWDDYLLGTAAGKLWSGMSASERVTSATTGLVWTGTNVTAAVPSVLTAGAPGFAVTAPASRVATYAVGLADFGPALASPGVSAELMPVTESGSLGLACAALSPANAAAVTGKLALVSRGTCSFVVKVKNAQNAGAVGVLVADNAPGAPTGLGGSDATIAIPSVRIAQADGVTLMQALATRSRTRSGVFGTLGRVGSQYNGADTSNRMFLYTPNPLVSGSSVSHFDVSASRNLLMEPAISGDLTHSVVPPNDLTFDLLKDIGWN